MKPRVLLVEDEPVNRAFLGEVLAGCGLGVDAASTCAQALALAGTRAHALWLVDAHLPDGDAVALLPRLRAASPAGTALAHTASRDAVLHAGLLDAGYAGVLVKPLATPVLVAAVDRALGAGTTPPATAWDDAAATAALGGSAEHVRELRVLYAAELPGAVAGVEAAFNAGDVAAVRAALHRLSAACALAGARRMGEAVRRLCAAPTDRDALDAFLRAARAPAPL